MKLALRIYRRLAGAFPHEFQMAYGTGMLQLGEDVVAEIARRHGLSGLLRLIADIAVRLVIEYLSEMRRDTRYAARALLKSPGFALVGIVSLGLGMGITTHVFGNLWTGLFRDLPEVSHAADLVMPQDPVSYYYIGEFRSHKSLFTNVAAVQTGVPFSVAFTAASHPQRVFGQLVSPDYFAVLGVRPLRGRLFSNAVDHPGGSPVVVITDRFWRNRLNSSPAAVGQTLRINGQTATIVGITPGDFQGILPSTPAELFVPLTAPPALAPELAGDILQQRGARAFIALLRLAPGVTADSAEAALDTIVRRLDSQDPALPKLADKGRRVTLLPGGKTVPVPRALRPVLVGFVAVLIGLVLAIACMNLANMLLARGAARRKELAIRLAVGASRFRLIRQMMAEGILLSLLGGLAGFAFSYWLAIAAAHSRLPSAVPTQIDPIVDWTAALFTFALAVVCGIGFSLAPALQATKAAVAPTLKEGAAFQLRGYRRFGMRNLLVLGQVAGSLMLLLITGLLVIGFTKTATVQTKFDPAAMYLFSIDPVRGGYSSEKAQALFENLPGRLRNLPGVTQTALAGEAPFSIPSATAQLTVPQHSGPSQTARVIRQTVGPDYFASLGEPLLAGREFTAPDQRIHPAPDSSATLALPVILNQTAARAFFKNGNAVGRRLTEHARSYQVIGVVRDLKNGIPDETIPSGAVYLPLTARDFAQPPAGGITVMVRAPAGAPVLQDVRREIASMDPNLDVFDARTLAEYLNDSRSSIQLSLDMFIGIGVFGLVLASIGLAGVTAYAVARRRKEIGIRMALGARRSQVLRLVLREGATLVAVGTALGFLGAMALATILSSLASIFVDALSVSTHDPRLLAGAPLLLAALAMLACYIPARESIRIDPHKALREE